MSISPDASLSSPEKKGAVMSHERSFLTTVLEAAIRGDYRAVQNLVEQYIRDNNVTSREVLSQFRDGRGRTVLHFACQSLTPLKASGACVDADNDVEAKLYEMEDIVYMLLLSPWAKKNAVCRATPDTSSSSVIRIKDKTGLTPLMLAAQLSSKSPNLSLIRIRTLLKAGGDKLSLARSKNGATALHYAAGCGEACVETITTLYHAGKVAVNATSNQGGSPLHWAAGVASGSDCRSIIEALVDECNADINSLNQQGLTPLILAVAACNELNAIALVSKGADRGACIPNGNQGGCGERMEESATTVYHMAADLNLIGTLRAMLQIDQGVGKNEWEKSVSYTCCNTKNHEGLTPLDVAARESHKECVILLLSPDSIDGVSEDEARLYLEEFHKKEHSPTSPDSKLIQGKTEDSDKSSTGHDRDESVSNGDEVAKVESKAKEHVNELLYNAVSVSDGAKESAQKHKEAGNSLFAAKNFKDAIVEYTSAITGNPTDATYYSNRSACYLALEDNYSALSDAAYARHLQTQWPKGWYRLSLARLALQRYEDAALAAWEGVQLDHDNEELKRLLQKCVKMGQKDYRMTQ